MKTLYKLLISFLLSLIVIGESWSQVPTGYQCSIRNDSLLTSSIYEFDIYLQNTDIVNTFELALFQAGIVVNPSIKNGGTITASIVSGSSQLVAAQPPVGV